jgi:hypothetical protein
MKKVQRGIVLEVNKKYIILLTPAGDCLKVRHPGGNIRLGEEFSCSASRPAWPKVVATAACLTAAALILIAVIPAGASLTDMFDGDNSVQGYLVLDINPSLELSFNAELEVTAFHPLNEDAVLLLEGLEVGTYLFDIVGLLLERSIELSFLNPDEKNLILIALVQIKETNISPQLLADLIERKLSTYGISGDVGIFETSNKDRNEALETGISLNRHLLLEALHGLDKEKVIGDDLPSADLLSGLKNRLPFSEFRTTVVPELPTQVPFDSDDLPGPPGLPVDLPVLPEQAENRKEKKPVLPELPVPVPFVPLDKPGPPD